MNPYIYGWDDPVTMTDPTGMEPCYTNNCNKMYSGTDRQQRQRAQARSAPAPTSGGVREIGLVGLRGFSNFSTTLGNFFGETFSLGFYDSIPIPYTDDIYQPSAAIGTATGQTLLVVADSWAIASGFVARSAAATALEVGGTSLSLRLAYVQDVNSIADNVASWRRAGATPEEIAREAWADRRAIGIQYKEMTPSWMLEQIYARNEAVYGDRYGPTIEWFLSRGDSWTDIISSSIRFGGKDLGF